jgi:hypothetical protein
VLVAVPLLPSRIKGDWELQTVCEMVGSKNSEWGATRIWNDRTPQHTLPAKAQPFFLFSVFAGMVLPFSPFLLVILEMYGIQAIHLHPRSVALLAIFAYACEAWIGIKPSMVYFSHLFTLRSSGLNQSSGCVSFTAIARTKDDFIDLNWMKKVEDFLSRCLFVDILEDSEFFLVTTWASEVLPEVVLKALRPRIRDLHHEGVTGPMVGVEFVTRRIAPYRITVAQSGRTRMATTDMLQMYLEFLMLHACFTPIALCFVYTSWHFNAFSGTNLLTRCHSASSYFLLFLYFKKVVQKIFSELDETNPEVPILLSCTRSPKKRRRRAPRRHTIGWHGPTSGHATTWCGPRPSIDIALLPIYFLRCENPKESSLDP